METKLPHPAPTIPKTIWMLWYQGLEQAPDLVKACHASWQLLNPGWTVHFLDAANFRSFISTEPFEQPGQRPQALSDFIRIALLAKYGGVWVDATTFCQTPLDSWLNSLPTGFFAFDRTDRPRYMDAWCMASSEGNYLTSRLYDMTCSYWRDNPGLRLRPKVGRYLETITNSPKRTGLWLSYPVTKLLKIYPYMWLAYLFSELMHSDPQARKVWDKTPKLNARIAHSLRYAGMIEPLNDEIKLEIDTKSAPVYKLDWRLAKDGIPKGSNLHYLLTREVADRRGAPHQPLRIPYSNATPLQAPATRGETAP